MEIGLAGVLAALFALAFAREPRAMRCAVLLLGVLAAVAVRLLGLVISALAERSDLASAWFLLAILAVIALMVAGVAVLLVLNGLTMLRREGRSLGNLLSLGLGVAILASIGVGAVVLATNSVQLVVLVLLASLPVGFLAYGFIAYLVYSPLYQRYARSQGRGVVAIVVLGSGLIDGQVPPLLAGRLDRARQVYARASATGTGPVVVTSGGQGVDEPRSEASAMAEYLGERGIPEASILVEDGSRNTDENLGNTAELLAERGIVGPVAVVTNDFHAFRSAMAMRRAGIRGYVLGARTADYFWPSATIREYLAILRDHRWFVVSALAVLTLPLAGFLASAAG
ncbi:MAG: YdcF family protein [Propionicimonas sp.]